MKSFKIILVVLLIVLVIIQFIHPKRNIATTQSPQDIAVVYGVPEKVGTVLNKACNDCHSNNTAYPWYANVQPVAWYLANHVNEGKQELNFSEFGSYPIRKQYHKLEEVSDMVKKDEMPLGSYTIIHTDAKLSNDEKELLVNWAEGIRSAIASKYPPDSLVRKKR